MDHLTLWRPAAAVLGAVLALGAQAQTQTTPARTHQATPVVTDVGPPPAEDRNSVGAVVLEHSPVRAQREATAVMGSSASPADVAKPANKALKRSDQKKSRDHDSIRLREQGAGSLVEN